MRASNRSHENNSSIAERMERQRLFIVILNGDNVTAEREGLSDNSAMQKTNIHGLPSPWMIG